MLFVVCCLLLDVFVCPGSLCFVVVACVLLLLLVVDVIVVACV